MQYMSSQLPYVDTLYSTSSPSLVPRLSHSLSLELRGEGHEERELCTHCLRMC